VHLDLRFVDEFHGPENEKALSVLDRALVVARDWLTPA
jgi:predicted DNA-binding ArsR family transcriptional regulator